MVLGDPSERVIETYQGVVTHRLRTPMIQSHPDYGNQVEITRHTRELQSDGYVLYSELQFHT